MVWPVGESALTTGGDMQNGQIVLNLINSLLILFIVINVFQFTTANKELLRLMIIKTKLEIQILELRK